MTQVLTEDANAIDVGTYRGDLLAHIVRLAPKGRHLAVEPIDENCSYLRARFPTVEVVEAAASDVEGINSFQHVVDRPARSGLRIVPYPDPDPRVCVLLVRTVRLDGLVPEHRVIRFLKIDVEGAEFAVLRGARGLITRCRPIIVFEYAEGLSSAYGTTPEEMYELICCELGLSVNLLSRWLAGAECLSKTDFLQEIRENGSFYFIACPQRHRESVQVPRAVSEPDNSSRLTVTMLGTLPPLLGISGYCRGLALALADRVNVEFQTFGAMSQRGMHPRGQLEFSSSLSPEHPNLKIRHDLDWQRPDGWVRVALSLKGGIVHAQFWSLPLAPLIVSVLAGARARGLATVCTVHNVNPRDESRAFRVATRAVLALTDQLILHSPSHVEELVDQFSYDPQSISVIPHGVPTVVGEACISRVEARRLLGIDVRRPVVLVFGSICSNRGLDVAIGAMRVVVEEQPDALLLVAGPVRGSVEPHACLVRRLELDESIRMDIGIVSEAELSKYFSGADVVVLPYLKFSSAQSSVGATALGYGLPLVVSRIGASAGLVKDPDSAVSAGDPMALGRRLASVLGDNQLRNKLARDSRDIASLLSWSRVAERTLRVYARTTKPKTER